MRQTDKAHTEGGRKREKENRARQIKLRERERAESETDKSQRETETQSERDSMWPAEWKNRSAQPQINTVTQPLFLSLNNSQYNTYLHIGLLGSGRRINSTHQLM